MAWLGWGRSAAPGLVFILCLLGCSGGEPSKGSPGSGGMTGHGGEGGDPGDFAVPGAERFDCSPVEGQTPSLALEQVAGGFSRPVLVTFAPGGDALYVVEQDGVIRIVNSGVVAAEPFLDINGRVHSPQDDGGGEQGLLGLAFHPDYQENGLFYVHYSASSSETDFANGTTVLAEFSLGDDENTADQGSERILLTETQPASNHNGGTVTFGPDRMLYLALGDGGGSGDQHDNGQNTSTLEGSLLRIDPDSRGEGQYGIPAGNLHEILPGAAPEIFSYGLRNPYRITFDGCTGDLYIGDVGQNTAEEINVTAAGAGQLNYGWPIMEGSECFQSATCDRTGLTLPLADYPTAGGGAVTGGSVYRGATIPGLRGAYIYADSVQGRAWLSRYDASTATLAEPTEITNQFDTGSIVSIQNGPEGELFVTTLFPGALHRVVAR